MWKWLKKKIKSVLGIRVLESRTHNQRQCIESLEKRVKQLESLVEVGLDVGISDPSWAVICFAGNPQFVRFVSLGKADVKQIKKFLNRFQHSRNILDLPMGYVPQEYFL